MSAKQSILVTGLTGFVGSHLARILADEQLPHTRYNLMRTVPYNLVDIGSLENSFEQAPDIVIHLAGQTFVPRAFANPTETFEINLLGTLNLLQTLKKKNFRGTFLYVSSGDIYGSADPAELPLSEKRLPRPQNPYAVSKAAAELLSFQWGFAEKWRVIVARPFNHIGAGQRSDFVLPSAARQIARIKHNLQPPQILVGDVEVTRDFLDVADVIDAYFTLIEHGETQQIYNVCSGQEYLVRSLIETMLELAGIEADIVQDTQRLRPTDQRRVRGDNSRLLSLGNWRPQPIEVTLNSIIQDWEQRYVNE